MTNKVDVVICGSGSAGLSAATWLARYGIRCKILESRPGPMEWGVADGIQARTTEIFESFGIEDDLLREGYHNVEVAFWNPVGKDGSPERTRSVVATEEEMSHLPRLILSQARIHDILLRAMREFNSQEVDYGYKVLQVNVDEEKVNDPGAHPVTIITEKEGKEERFEAKFALVCLIHSQAKTTSSTHQLTMFRVVMVRTVRFENLLASRWLEMDPMRYGVSWTLYLGLISQT